ncbi:protein LATERAL BRANCHING OXIDOREDUCTASE 1-like isoform X1 [Apium graveolens]|uniref:protein LATERAL BRANCHING OXIDOREDUCTASE 1-like isoform X1 n=1 Tax=Apium graveolens TaxID=4045 RepID=UPI003D7A8458
MATTDNQIVKEIDCVEEIVKMDPSFIPKRYILTEKDVFKDMELPLLSAEVPVIDMALLSEGQEEELKKLDEACMYWGFFLVINHGIDEGVLEDMKTAASVFFKLPLEEKMRYPFDPLAIEGYGRPYPVTEDQTVDWSDSLMFRLFPVRGRKLKLWPNKPAELKGAVEAYSVEIGNVSRKLLGSLSLIMGMESNDLPELHKEMQISMRVNYYPVCCEPEIVMGMSPHSDATTITILLQDNKDNNINGLQIRHNGGWVPVQPVPKSLIVNVGDVLEIWSNGKYKSIEHRAMTNGTRARISYASFVTPQMEVEVEPLKQMFNDSQQKKLYKKVIYEDYIRQSLQSKLEGKAYIANYTS